MKYKLIVILVLASFQLFSQDRLYTSSVNFRKNKTDLSRSEINKLDIAIDSIKSKSPLSILIKGFADSDADSLYNYNLSAMRCKSVQDYLLEKGVQVNLIKTFPMGEELSSEDEETEEAKLKNRRVDLVLIWERKANVVEVPKIKNRCDKDTTILLNYGVIATMKVCELEKNKDCIQLEARKQVHYDLKLSRFRLKLGLKNYYKVKKKTVTYEVNYYCKDSTCGKASASLLVPFLEVKEKQYKVEVYDSLSMSYQTYKESKIKSIKKKQYIYMPKISCSYDKIRGKGCGTYWIGCGGFYPRCSCKMSKIKFKQGLEVVTVNDIKEIQESSVFLLSKSKKTLFLNPDSYIRSLTLYDGTDTVRISDGVELSALRHGLLRSKSCDKKWFLFMKIHRRCDSYKKYKFRRKDVELQQRKPWQEEDNIKNKSY